MECWSSGAVRWWNVGSVEYWSNGVLEFWSVVGEERWSSERCDGGMLEVWNTGVMM